jgi:Zn-dependent protease with chaperone function
MRDFLKRQEHAQSRTASLVTLLTLATGITIIATGCVVGYCLVLTTYMLTPYGEVWHWKTHFGYGWVAGSAVACFVVMGGAAWRAYQLRGGGAALAEGLGGRLLAGGPASMQERQLANIVDELALAIGVPAPRVYLLPGELGINAFAAGYSIDSAVIGVTQGCVERLNRDQMQGVVAHEFSHIVNGDMRLNMQSLAALHGILSIAIVSEEMISIGRFIINSPGRSSDPMNGTLLIIAGTLMWPIGLIGATCAGLVTAAINRQREFLADACAVEFTRHPVALADALKVIAGHTARSRVNSRLVGELSHLFFANGREEGQWSFNTHPSLASRIQRLDPEWDGLPLFDSEVELPKFAGAYQGAMHLVGGQSDRDVAADSNGHLVEPGDFDPALAECLDRWLRDNHAEVVQQLSPQLLSVVDDPSLAALSLGALVVTADSKFTTTLETLWNEDGAGEGVEFRSAFQALAPLAQTLTPSERVVLVDRALLACGKSTAQDQQACQWLLQQIERLPRRSWAVRGWAWLLQNQLSGSADQPVRARHGSLEPLRHECEVVLSAIINTSQPGTAMGLYAFQRATGQLALDGLDWLNVVADDADDFFESVELLAETPAKCRRSLLLAASLGLSADGKIGMDEAVLVRVLCRAWGFPAPLVLPCARVMVGT